MKSLKIAVLTVSTFALGAAPALAQSGFWSWIRPRPSTPNPTPVTPASVPEIDASTAMLAMAAIAAALAFAWERSRRRA